MIRTAVLAALAFACVVPVQARHHHHRRIVHQALCVETGDIFHPVCGMGQVASPRTFLIRGEAFRRAAVLEQSEIVSHPRGCPARLFCGCGAAVRVFGAPIRSLWLAANWFRFPRTSPAPGMVAVHRHHVFVLERPISGSIWLTFDANSGQHLTRIHARSIAGWTIVNPHAG